MDAAPVDWRPDSVFVQAGTSARDARVAGVGLRWAAPWPAARWGAGWSGAMELSWSRWSMQVAGVPEALVAPAQEPVRDHAAQLVVMPLVRWQLQQGRSAWFAEAGLGLSLHDRVYRVERVRQASRLNFQEVIALGRSVGAGQAVSLRLSHMSNAGLRKPNPGETWLSLRWDYAF